MRSTTHKMIRRRAAGPGIDVVRHHAHPVDLTVAFETPCRSKEMSVDKDPLQQSRHPSPAAGGVASVLMCVAISLALLYFLRSLLVPFFVALLMAALIEGLVRALAQRWPRGPRWALIVLAGGAIM